MPSSNNVVVPDRQPFDGMDYVRLDATVQTMLGQSNVNFKDNVATPGDLPSIGNEVDDFRLVISNWFVYRRDWSSWVQPTSLGTATLLTANFPTFSGVGLDDMNAGSVYTGQYPNTYTITISATGLADSFTRTSTQGGIWWPTVMTWNDQLLDSGVGIRFGSTTWHTIGDSWQVNIIEIPAQFFNGNILWAGTGIGYLYNDTTNWLIGISALGNFLGWPDWLIHWLVEFWWANRQAFTNAAFDGVDMRWDATVRNGTSNFSIVLDTSTGISLSGNSGIGWQYTFPATTPSPWDVLTAIPWPSGTLDRVPGWGWSSLVWYTNTVPTPNTALWVGTAANGVWINNTWLWHNTGGWVQAWDGNTLVWKWILSSNVNSLNESTIVWLNTTAYARPGWVGITAIGYQNITGVWLWAYSVSIGHTAASTGVQAISIWYVAQATGTESIAIGTNASTIWHTFSIALGSKTVTTLPNQMVVWSNTAPVTDYMFGSGYNSTAPQSISLRASQASWANVSWADFNIYAGNSTGSGIGGWFLVYTSPGWAASSSLNPYMLWLQIWTWPSRISRIGDTTNAFNGNQICINDFASQIFVQTDGDFGVQNTLWQRAISVNFSWGTDFLFEAGDVGSINNGTRLSIADASWDAILYTDWTFRLQTATWPNLFFYAAPNSIVIGRNSSGNNTNFSLDDTTESMLGNLDWVFRLQTTAGVTKFLVDLTTSLVTIASVPAHADDAAATGAGLTTGQLYKTTTGGSTFLKIVP